MDTSNILEKGEMAVARLINRTHLNFKFSIETSTIAVNELLCALSLMTNSRRWLCALSSTMNSIWELAVLDTLHYVHLCNYSCYLNNKPLQMIQYDPDLWGIGTLVNRQINTFILYKDTFGTPPKMTFWMDVILKMISANILDNENFFINIIKKDFRENESIYLTSIKKNKKVIDLINILAKFENTSPNNLRLIFNSNILNNMENSLDSIFDNNEPVVHLLVRTLDT